MDEGSLKRGHVPTHDTPGKPENKRRPEGPEEAPVSRTGVRRTISDASACKTTTKSPAQKVRLYQLICFPLPIPH